MIWAIVNNEKVEATPQSMGQCPLCGSDVFSRCGEINAWHWSHFKKAECDNWYEPESFWHLHWKRTFGKENAEIVIEKENKRHIADILTKEDVVIELQNSPIQSKVIKKREAFYGKRMLWLINGEHFKESFQPRESRPRLYRYRHFYDDSHLIKQKDPTIQFFNWKWARKSWVVAERPVFIDFGEDNLLWVTEGMGTFSIQGKLVSKERFINKYGGDYNYYLEANEKA